MTTVIKPSCRSGNFILGCVAETLIHGYTMGEHWNGWACPFLEKAAADALILQLNDSYQRFGEPRRAYYDAGRDVFVTPYDGGDDDEWDSWGAEIINVDGAERKVYSIGSQAWCWIEVPAEERV
jgi:hypothetical protein